jgi:hypothetical protein
LQRAQTARNQAPAQIAQTLGMKKSLKIMGLRDCECVVTATIGVQAAARRLVEFSCRAAAGFAGD